MDIISKFSFHFIFLSINNGYFTITFKTNLVLRTITVNTEVSTAAGGLVKQKLLKMLHFLPLSVIYLSIHLLKCVISIIHTVLRSLRKC